MEAVEAAEEEAEEEVVEGSVSTSASASAAEDSGLVLGVKGNDEELEEHVFYARDSSEHDRS